VITSALAEIDRKAGPARAILLPAVIPNPVRAPNALNRPPTGARAQPLQGPAYDQPESGNVGFPPELYENFKTMGHYSGGLSPGDDSHSVMCEAASSCRALRDKSSRPYRAGGI
jgi:hypothetical protein